MFRGTLDDFTLPEILRMLAFSKKTGTLRISRRAGTGRITFRDGKVVYAETELSSSRLGQKLVGAGKLTPTQLRQGLDAQATTNDRLGRILLGAGAVTAEALQEAVRAQVEEAAFELMCWEAGEFAWEPGSATPDDAEVALDIEDLMVDVTTRLREQDQIKRRLEAPGAVPRLVPHPTQGPGDINISPQQWRVLVLVDGRRTVAELAQSAGLPTAETVATLQELIAAGLVDVDEAPTRAAAPPADRPPEAPAVPAEVGSPTPQPEVVVPAPAPVAKAPDGDGRAFGPSEPVVPAATGDNNGRGTTDALPPDEWFEDPEEAREADGLQVAFPPPEPNVEDLPRVDRAAAVRELSGLFDEPKSAPKPPPPAPDPKKRGATEAAANAKGLIARFGRRAASD